MDYTLINSREMIRQRKSELRQEMQVCYDKLKQSATDVVIPVNRSMLRSDESFFQYVSYGLIAYRTMRRVQRIVRLFRSLQSKQKG